jgi:hypothetical protein
VEEKDEEHTNFIDELYLDVTFIYCIFTFTERIKMKFKIGDHVIIKTLWMNKVKRIVVGVKGRYYQLVEGSVYQWGENDLELDEEYYINKKLEKICVD